MKFVEGKAYALTQADFVDAVREGYVFEREGKKFSYDPGFSAFCADDLPMSDEWKLIDGANEFMVIKSPIPDKAPLLCWDDDDKYALQVRFYDSESGDTFDNEGERDGDRYDNMIPYTPEAVADWVKNAAEGLE